MPALFTSFALCLLICRRKGGLWPLTAGGPIGALPSLRSSFVSWDTIEDAGFAVWFETNPILRTRFAVLSGLILVRIRSLVSVNEGKLSVARPA